MTLRRTTLELDALIFGGGIAGLWLLDELHRRGFGVALVESRSLGAGQTICAQGILHGGLKYALGGIISESSKSVREMPAHWSACLAGETQPDLSKVRTLSPHCHLWRTDSLSSRMGLIGARALLRTPMRKVEEVDRPAVFRSCPGQVFRVEEPVLDVASLLFVFADRHRSRLWRTPESGKLLFSRNGDQIEYVDFVDPQGGEETRVRAASIILTAGEGNESLRRGMGIANDVMQRRPLHMVMVRGNLPELFGHCIDGNKTRLTVTSARDRAGRTIWNLGGDIAEERGVARETSEQIAAAKRELIEVLPGVDFHDVEYACYRVDRAEGHTSGGGRPDGPIWRREGNVISAWPTKLVLAPRLAEDLADQLVAGAGEPRFGPIDGPERPRPCIADPPWEVTREWHS